jgi:hypothetical protein
MSSEDQSPAEPAMATTRDVHGDPGTGAGSEGRVRGSAESYLAR